MKSGDYRIMRGWSRVLLLVTCHLLLMSLVSCSTAPVSNSAQVQATGISRAAGVLPGINGDDSSQDGPPLSSIDFAAINEPVPKVEPLARYGNMAKYKVLGKHYRTLSSSEGYVERGIASWYGTKFHNHRTSSGEPYDLYAISGAHKSLPLPCYVRVTNLDNQRSLIVRVNDRGPFHDDRVIDLSYVAAAKLGILATGTGRVEVRAIDPQHTGQPTLLAASEPATPRRAVATAVHSVPLATTRDTRISQLLATHQEQPQPLAENPPPIQPAVTVASLDQERIYLQMGAFSSRENAEQLRARLLQGGALLDQPSSIPSSTPQPGAIQPTAIQIRPSVVNQVPVYRVRLGPLPDVSEADRLTRSITTHGFTAPVVVID